MSTSRAGNATWGWCGISKRELVGGPQRAKADAEVEGQRGGSYVVLWALVEI